MQRRKFTACIVSEDEKTSADRTTYAWNSAIKATEDMVRTVARTEGQTYTGEKADVSFGGPGDSGALYTRAWRGDRNGRLIIAAVCEEES